MKDNNTPILGDRKYGIKDGFRHMMLLANKLEFIHPVTHQKICIDLGIPDEYLKQIKN
jgi:23S rRNA-/tRNA-specific pseudouridylate synthase